jgi:hypothetical protein
MAHNIYKAVGKLMHCALGKRIKTFGFILKCVICRIQYHGTYQSNEKNYMNTAFLVLTLCTHCSVLIYTFVFQIMSPPPYSDLGKNARDVFNKGYHFGLLKLDCKTKTSSGVEFSSGGSSNQDTGKVFGSLETKYKVPDYGML